MDQTKQCRILVLAPTNKACDVLAKKVLELEPENDYWLWRFVSTMDPELEDEEIVYQRNSDIMRQDQVCVVSTIARYSFDGFEDGMLNSINWDYVIIDEASMIPLTRYFHLSSTNKVAKSGLLVTLFRWIQS